MTPSPRTVWLRQPGGALVTASLVRGLNEAHIDHWRALWCPAREQALSRLASQGKSRPNHAHWDWERKLRKVSQLLGFTGFAVECDGVPQGLMLLDLVNETAKLPEQRGKPLVHVQYLETAPWNTTHYVSPVRYQGVGAILVRAAIELSLDNEFRGRIGLLSLPQSEGYYRQKIGMTDMGPYPSPNDLRYFEATEAQASEFIRKTGGENAD